MEKIFNHLINDNTIKYNINNPSLSKAIIYYIKYSNYLDKKTNKVRLIDFKQIKDIYLYCCCEKFWPRNVRPNNKLRFYIIKRNIM